MTFVSRHDLPFLGYSAAVFGLRFLPQSLHFRWLDTGARWLGLVWYRLDRAGAELARRNLRGVLGRRLSAGQVEVIALKLFQNVALNKLINDMLPELALDDLGQLLKISGVEYVQTALSQGRGVVLLGTHFGIPGYPPLVLLRRLGYEVDAVLGEEIESDDTWIYRHIVYPLRSKTHRRYGVIAPNGTGMPQRRFADSLQQNQILLLLGDVLDRDFFELSPPHVAPTRLAGHTVRLHTGPFRLAHWRRSPIVPYFMKPRPGGFEMVIERPLSLSEGGENPSLTDDLAAFTARFEPYLLDYPWLWAHWRHKELLDLMQPEAAEDTFAKDVYKG